MTMGITSPTSTTGQILKNGSAVISFDANNNATFAGNVAPSANPTMRNRIINGAMVIDQRNAGAAVNPSTTVANGYAVDRFYVYASQASKLTAQQNAGSVTPPAGFTNYFGITSSSAYTIASSDIFVLQHVIEGYNVADFAWGTANAKTVTLSFWVRSSLTGTFGGTLQNGASARNYAFSYTISAANTWQQVTVTIPGDTSGTWLTTNGRGLWVNFGIAVGSTYSIAAGSWSATESYSVTGNTSVVGTNGATFYITGVQLEVGSVATPFEQRLYGTELALCQRYYYYLGGDGSYNYFGIASITSTTAAFLVVYLPVTMRSSPTLSYVGTVGNFDLRSSGNNQHFLTNVLQDQSSTKVCGFALYTTGLTANTPGILIPNNSTANQLTFNAEL